MRFRSKVVEIEAIQFDGYNVREIEDFMGEESSGMSTANNVRIHTLEGDMTASILDWIVRGLKGEYYPIKPDIFEMKYERIE